MATAGGNVNVKERLKKFEGRDVPQLPKTMSGTNDSGTGQPWNSKHLSKQNDGALFKEPVRFIFTDEKTGKLRFDEETVQLLSEIMQPLNVVAITGLSRTGKSYLLNKLARGNVGFELGHTLNACTKGIWLWCRHHPRQEDQVLLLLDVEGVGDPRKVKRKEDIWLFTIATVLSSTLIYNNKNSLDSYALDRLNFLEEIDSTIQVSQEEEYEKFRLDFDFYFPSFVVVLRDCNLKVVNRAGQSCTPDEYLEEQLDQEKGTGEDIEKYNKVRLLLRRYFKKRKCFIFKTPCVDVEQLNNLPDRDIQTSFLETLDDFCNHILESKPLQLKSGHGINGRMFANLAMRYVNDMGQHKQPSITEARAYMVQTENQAIVVAASDIYKKEMQNYLSRLGNSVPKNESLVKFHEIFVSKALEEFKTRIVFEDEEVVRNETMGACKRLLNRFKRICDDHSTKACQDAIKRLNKRVEKKLQTGIYCCVSGYDEYKQDINWIVRQYTGLPGLGSQSEQILQGYLDGKKGEEEQVYQMVVNAQKGRTNADKTPPTPNRQPIRSTDGYAIRPNRNPFPGKTDSDKPPPIPKYQPIGSTDDHAIRRGSFSNSLKTQVKKIEIDMTQTVSEQHTKEKKTIKETYIENLKSKIEELQRQKSEQSGNLKALKEIERQIAYLNKIYTYAIDTVESMTDTMPDKDADVELSGEWEHKSARKERRSFCRMQ